MKRIKFLILLLPLLSGCYNYRELNELGITTAVSIDYKDNNFYVIAEVINPIKQQDASSSNNSPFVNYNSSSSSLQDAFRKVVLESPRQLYAAQLEIIVLSEEVVNNHLEEVLEYFARDPESRTEIKIIVAKTEDSTKAITLQTLLTSLSSSNIINSLDLQSKVLGMSYPVTLNELLNMYIDPYLEVVLPSMTLYGNYEIGDEKENITTSSCTCKFLILWINLFLENQTPVLIRYVFPSAIRFDKYDDIRKRGSHFAKKFQSPDRERFWKSLFSIL